MSGTRLSAVARVALFVGLASCVPSSSHAVGIKILKCGKQSATEMSALASGVCQSQARLQSSETASTIYIVTLSAEEARGGTERALQLAERDLKRGGYCEKGIELVAGPMPDGRTGQTQMAVRCSSTNK